MIKSAPKGISAQQRNAGFTVSVPMQSARWFGTEERRAEMAKRIMTDREVIWAHRKWCEGHSLEAIADALHVCSRTIYLEFKRRGMKRVKIPLKYDPNGGVK